MPKRIAQANAAKSEVRARVEHVFARQKGPMALVIRIIGLARVTVKIGLANLIYNMHHAPHGLARRLRLTAIGGGNAGPPVGTGVPASAIATDEPGPLSYTPKIRVLGGVRSQLSSGWT